MSDKSLEFLKSVISVVKPPFRVLSKVKVSYLDNLTTTTLEVEIYQNYQWLGYITQLPNGSYYNTHFYDLISSDEFVSLEECLQNLYKAHDEYVNAFA